MRVTIATARTDLAPAATAAATALRSAQIVSPYDAFSTLQPAWIAAAVVEHGGADREARVGRVRVRANGARRREQRAAAARRIAARLNRSLRRGSDAITAAISEPSASEPAAAARVTSSWRSGSFVTPAAWFETSDRPEHRQAGSGARR